MSTYHAFKRCILLAAYVVILPFLLALCSIELRRLALAPPRPQTGGPRHPVLIRPALPPFGLREVEGREVNEEGHLPEEMQMLHADTSSATAGKSGGGTERPRHGGELELPSWAGPLAKEAASALNAIVAQMGGSIRKFDCLPAGPQLKVSLPAWINIEYLSRRLARSLRGVEVSGTEGRSPFELHRLLHLERTRDDKVEYVALVVSKPRPRGRVAIVVDDLGFNESSTKLLMRIPFPLTTAVLPFYKGSRSSARRAWAHCFDVILHMPMEAHEELFHGKLPYRRDVVIGTRHDAATIRKRLSAALADIPHVIGINNHTGSRATENRRVMRCVLEELSRRGLFFIDSLTSRHSCAYRLARRMKVPTLKRNFPFIDDAPGFSNAYRLLRRLARNAGKSSSPLVAIMHDRLPSVKALHRALPLFRKYNVELVYARQLMGVDGHAELRAKSEEMALGE